MQLAAENNQLQIAKIFLDVGAGKYNIMLLQKCNVCNKTMKWRVDPNNTSHDGLSVLHFACSNSSNGDVTELVKLIVDRYAAIIFFAMLLSLHRPVATGIRLVPDTTLKLQAFH